MRRFLLPFHLPPEARITLDFHAGNSFLRIYKEQQKLDKMTCQGALTHFSSRLESYVYRIECAVPCPLRSHSSSSWPRLFVVKASPPSSRAKGCAEEGGGEEGLCVARGAEEEGKEGSKEFSICRRQEGGEEEEKETGNACPTVRTLAATLSRTG